MAGLGSSWGSREEFLHPRDSHGRFRTKWKMAAGVIDAISNFLERFNPRTFQSDGQASQYLFNRAKPSRFGGGTQYARLHADFDEANQHLRSGDIDPSTQKFIKMMDDSSVNLDSELILSRTVGPEAFGLSLDRMNLEEGGIEDFTGRLIGDRGYAAANIGTPMGHGPGKVTMSIAVPKGTKVIIPARSQNDRGIFLDRDQELRITKVQSDGRGGWYMMAIATPRTPGETPEPIDRGPRGIGLNPQQREARIAQSQGRQAKREGIRTDAAINAEEVQQGTQQVKREQQPAQAPAAPQQPAAPGEPPPRNEPVLKESVGGADTQGKGTAEIAQTPVEQPTTPEAPAAPAPNIREAVQAAGVPSPSAGPRRRQWNNAYLGVASGKKDPGDMLRELDRDIEHFKGLRKDNKSTGTEDPNLDSDIDAMEQLADVISSEYNIPRTGPAGEKRRGPARIPEESRARLVQQRKELRAKAQPDSEQAKLEKARAELQAREAADRTNAKRKQEIEAENAADTELINRWLDEAGIDQSKLPDMDRVGLSVVAGSLRRGRISRAEAARRLRTDREGSRLNEIADLIEGQPIKAAKKAAPSKVAPIGQAPGEKRRELPGEAGTRGVTNIKAFKATKQEEIQAKEERKRRLLSPEAPPTAPEKKAPAKKATVTSIEKARAQRLTPEQQRQVSDLSDQERRSYQGFRGKGMTHADALQSAQDAVAARNAREAEKANKALAKKAAPPASKAVPETADEKRSRARELLSKSAGLDEQQARPVRQEAEQLVRDAERMDAASSKKAAPAKASPASTPDILARLNETDANDVPVLNRESAAELVAPLRKAQLVEIAKEYSIPSPTSKTVPELKRWIVEAGVGRRLDSIAIRGFTGRRPETPGVGLTTAEKLAGQVAGVPTTPEAGAAPDLDKMTVPELKKLAKDELVPLAGLTRKQQIKDAILRNRESGSGGVSTAGAEVVAGPGVLERMAEPNAPAAQKLVQAPDRRTDFAEAWLNTPAVANINEKTAAGRSVNEVRDDIAKGKITPDEGIRRLENDIDLNKQDLADVEREMRGKVAPQDFSRLVAERDKLRQGISDQENASSFLRSHFRKAPAITPDEIKIEVDPEVRATIEKLTPSQIRQMAKVSGYGDLKGDKKDDLLKDLIKKIAGRELESRAAKKAAPKKLAPAPLVTKKSSDPDYVDARAIAEGIGMTDEDSGMLAGIQMKLDGTATQKPMTPAAVGRDLEKLANGPGGPAYKAAVISGVNSDNMTPELQARHDSAMQQHARWMALAERLKKTRRRPARKATEPAPEKPKLTPDEKKVTTQAADVLGVPKEQLQKQALAKKVAAAPPPEAAKSAVDTMRTMQSREEGAAFLKNRTKGELQEIAKAGNISYGSKDTKQKITDQIVQWTIGRRLDSEAISRPAPPRFGEDKPQLENMAPSELADLEAELGIKRTSLDRGERIAAIRAKQSGQVPERKAGPKPEGEPVKSRRAPYVDVRGGLVAKRDRPLADEPVYLPNGGADQGLVHFDSELGQLWQNLYMDDREPNSFVNEIARIGDGVGSKGEGRIGLEEALNRLRALKKEAVDKAIEDRIQETINALDSPKVSLPDLPDTVPASVIRALKELADIPTARRTGKIGSARLDESILNKKIDIVRQIDAGKFRLGEPESKLRNRDLHESADGATTMWSIFEQLLNMPRKLPDDKPNPEWIELRDWLRGRHLQQ